MNQAMAFAGSGTRDKELSKKVVAKLKEMKQTLQNGSFLVSTVTMVIMIRSSSM